jgi:predicted O-linked N-acetylglucosamine transferase (SPINDLY family)
MGKKPRETQNTLILQVEKLVNEGNPREAIQILEAWCKKQTANMPMPAAELTRLAKLQFDQELYDEAIQTCAHLARGQAKPSNKRIQELFSAAVITAQENRNRESIGLHCELLALVPNHTTALQNGAVVLKRLKCYTTAERWMRRYLELKPACKHGLNALGCLLTELGRHQEAISSFQQVLAQDPNYAEANSNLANEYHLIAQIDEAFFYSSKSIRLAPDRLDLLGAHFTHLRRVCAFDKLEQIDWWTLLSRIPTDGVSTVFLQAMVLAEQTEDQQKLLSLVNHWGDHQAALATRQPGPPPRHLPSNPNEPLKIGFISADFRDHSVARFIWPLFEHLDRQRFALYGYSTYSVNDAWRQRFEQSATAIRDVGHFSALELQEIIQADGIHVLFDLTGFTRGSRTGLLAWRSSPVQVSWLGYPGSSGLPQMDYLFLDRHLAPEEPNLIRERPLISPGTTVCFSQLPEIPITPTIPEMERGKLTLGTLNNTYKITRRSMERWGRVLQALPEAQFLFVRREFESYYLRANIITEFKRLGIASTRIHFFNNRRANRHYLDCYNEIDFTLDTFPVTGGTTTSDALWMGVPVITLEGPNVHQRVGSAILHHAGHPEWIAKTDDEFVQIALELAADQPRRIALRQSLRGELKSSLLCNTKQFATDFATTMKNLQASWTS